MKKNRLKKYNNFSFFTTQVRVTRLLRILASNLLTFPTSMEGLYFPYRRKAVPTFASYTISGLSCLREYQMNLQKGSCKQGVTALKISTKRKLIDGQHFVINWGLNISNQQ